MTTAYPAGLDTLTNPTGTDNLDAVAVPHATQHANANDAIEAIEAELGLNPRGASATVKARLDALDTTVAAKAPTASPAFTGNPTAPTAAADDNDTSIATTAFVIGQAGASNPLMNNSVAVGTSKKYSREDHVHPVDTSRMPATLPINTQTASYTLVLGDAQKVVEVNNASANNLTIPLNSSVAFPVGTTIAITQLGAGQTTVVATGGVTLRSSGSKVKLTGQYSGATLYKRGTDEWVLQGDISA